MKKVNIENEYKKFPEMRKDEVLKLLEWVEQQPHLPNLEESEVILFFHACYYSMELAKKTIDTFLTTRTHCPEFFSNMDLTREEMKRAMNTVEIIPLKKSTPEGYRVIIGKLLDCDANNFNFADVMKLYGMCFDLWLLEEGIDSGHIIVIDMKGCTLGHIARIGIFQMKKFLYYLQDASAVRLKGFHFINIVPFMDKLMVLMNPFMKKELYSILEMHSNIETFFKFVPKEILPKDYGGSDSSCEILKKTFYDNMVKNQDIFTAKEKRNKVNEKLRPGKPKDASDLYGVEGNFKKLDID